MVFQLTTYKHPSRRSRSSLLLPLLLLTGNLFANDVENRFLASGLIDIHQVDHSIKVDLVNSNPDKNFFGENFYAGLDKAYLRPQVAQKLSKAQKLLHQKYPAYSLQILDAARPRSVSRAMYQKMKGTRFERYVARPEKGSMHNYGIAVDITIVDGEGKRLDMGPSPFFKSHAEIYWQYFLNKIGIDLSDSQRQNRALLSQVMLSAGFYPLAHEWWHFNGMKKPDARARFSIIE